MEVKAMASFIESVYFAGPIQIQQAIVATYGYWWYRRRFGPHFHRLVCELKGREYWSAEQFRTYQEQQLTNLLTAAWRSPYYCRVFNEVGITQEMSPFDAFSRIPFLSKDTLRSQAKDLLTEHTLPQGTIILKTSGTTGTPTEIYYTPEFHSLELAVPEARNLNTAGVTYKDRRVMFGVRKVCHIKQNKPPFWRFSPIEDMAYASIYHLSPSFLPYYLEFLRVYQPSVVMGYPSALYTIARHALDTGDMPSPAKAIITTSETVTTYVREAIEAAWKCKLYDRYGGVENCLFASQCEQGRYHVSPDVGLIEIVDGEGLPLPHGIMGEVICTGLHNTLHPLIRYRIGDAARWAVEQYCSCGRQMPIIEAVEGRFEDICYTPDGREMLRFDTVFKGIESIQEAQVVQERIDLYIIHVVPTARYGIKDTEQMKKNMYMHVGDVETQVKFVNTIPRAPSGKFRAVICKVPDEEKERIRQAKTTAGVVKG
jgi:phenylacetate-CoA ligase